MYIPATHLNTITKETDKGFREGDPLFPFVARSIVFYHAGTGFKIGAPIIWSQPVKVDRQYNFWSKFHHAKY